MDNLMTYLPQLAGLIASHSLDVQAGERVILEAIDMPPEVIRSFARALKDRGAAVSIVIKHQELMNWQASSFGPEEFDFMAAQEIGLMKQSSGFLGLRAPGSNIEAARLSFDQRQQLLTRFLQPVHYEYRNKHLKWLYFRWPTHRMAEDAEMNLEPFSRYYFDNVLVDYHRFELAMQPLSDLLHRTRKVHITHPNGTDLQFSLGGFGTYNSAGKRNLPDGEVFTSPVKDSAEGVIHFNIPSTYYGHRFDSISLEFSKGKVVKANARGATAQLNGLLDTDSGARFIGEFAFGLHPGISFPINDILFDEKMWGSIHLALGNAYPIADNGNRSAIHWDLILAQTPAYGGGEIFLDDTLIRKDGLFTSPDLQHLNPKSLTHTLTL